MAKTVSDAQLHAFFDGQLSDEEEREVIAYLEAHPDEMHRYREHDRQKHRLIADLQAEREDPTDPTTEALAAKLNQRVRKRERQVAMRRWLGGITGCIALLAAGWAGHTAYVGKSMPALIADAARDHVIFSRAERPIEIPGSDEALLIQAVAGHLGVEANIPNLSRHGYQLIGGRLLGAAEGPFVQLLYDDGADHPLTLYLARQGVPDDGVHITEIEGLGAGYWRDQALSYALVAEAPVSQVRQIITSLAEVR